MNSEDKPQDSDEIDDAIISADDTGMVASQHLIVEEQLLRLADENENAADSEGAPLED